MHNYKIVEGEGLGFTLYWFDGVEWQWVMDATDRDACLDYIRIDTKYAHEDRWGASGW